jgi:hypothetical protein
VNGSKTNWMVTANETPKKEWLSFWIGEKFLVKQETCELPFRQEQTRKWCTKISLNAIKIRTTDRNPLANNRNVLSFHSKIWQVKLCVMSPINYTLEWPSTWARPTDHSPMSLMRSYNIFRWNWRDSFKGWATPAHQMATQS